MFQFVVLYLKLLMNFFKNSYYYSDSAQRFAARINFNHSIVVAIKFYILYYKKTFMMFLIVNTIVFFGFLLKVLCLEMSWAVGFRVLCYHDLVEVG